MNISDLEEKNAKCHHCGQGLTYLENLLYGNRCIFHTEKIKNIGLLRFLIQAYYDWRIYQSIYGLQQIEQAEDSVIDPGSMILLGSLAEMGVIDICEVKTARDKRQLIGNIRYAKKQLCGV